MALKAAVNVDAMRSGRAVVCPLETLIDVEQTRGTSETRLTAGGTRTAAQIAGYIGRAVALVHAFKTPMTGDTS